MPPAEPHALTAMALTPTVTNILMRIVEPAFLSLKPAAPAGETRAYHTQPVAWRLVAPPDVGRRAQMLGGGRLQPLPPVLEALEL